MPSKKAKAHGLALVTRTKKRSTRTGGLGGGEVGGRLRGPAPALTQHVSDEDIAEEVEEGEDPPGDDDEYDDTAVGNPAGVNDEYDGGDDEEPAPVVDDENSGGYEGYLDVVHDQAELLVASRAERIHAVQGTLDAESPEMRARVDEILAEKNASRERSMAAEKRAREIADGIDVLIGGGAPKTASRRLDMATTPQTGVHARGKVGATPRVTESELQRWAEADPTGIAAKALTPMVVRGRGSVASSGPAGRLSSTRSDKPATRKYQTPWPASVDAMMSAYTQVVQQTRWWKGTQAETQLVNTPVRGAAGCRFGVLERWLFDGLMDPTTKVMVDETYKEAVVSTIDKDPRGYEILKTWLMSVDPNDLEATGDLPVEYIDRLARMMLTLTAIITSFRRRNDDPIAIGKCFGRLWATPVAWETVNAASWSTTRAQTVLKDRAGHDPFHAYDGTSATSKDPKVPSATVNTPIAVVAPLAPRPAPLRPATPAVVAPAVRPVAGGYGAVPLRAAPRGGAAPGQCANCLMMSAGHSARFCTGVCTRPCCTPNNDGHRRNVCPKP